MTTWFPIGPDFVFAPRDGNFKRLSRRNEYGRQGLVSSIAIDPTDASTIYIVETPTSGGIGVFRTDDDGASWTSLVDGLQRPDPGGVNPISIAVHPTSSGYVYLGTNSGRVYTSPNTRGATWGTPFNIGSPVFKLVVDPRTTADPATTTIFAGCNNGVWRSDDGGANFHRVLTQTLAAFAARIPTDGSTADFYAGAIATGVFHSTDPTGDAGWSNLNTTAGTNLPAVIAGTPSHPSGNFDNLRIDVCRANRRVYVWFFNTVCATDGTGCNETTSALCTTTNPTGAWTTVTVTSPPEPAYTLYDSAFAVAPSSPGDGLTDVLLFGSIHLLRSIDGGRTWFDTSTGGDEFHDDYHAFAFFPDNPPAGVVPATYIGSDGGLAVSTRIADRTAVYPPATGDADELEAYTNTAVAQNYNHGKSSSAIYQYNADPDIPALGYIGCQDTGVCGGDTGLVWRGIFNADAGGIAARQGADGVKVWCVLGSPFFMYMVTDRGEFNPAWTNVTMDGRPLVSTSNYVVDRGGNCLTGVALLNPGTGIPDAVAAGTRTVTPGSMAFIFVGSQLWVDDGTAGNGETVRVTAVTGTTFTAVFANAHNAGAGVTRTADTSLTAAVTSGVQTVTPGSMNGIVGGASLTIDGGSAQETVTVSSVSGSTFTATFARPHGADAAVVVNHRYLARVDQSAIARAISQDFGLTNPNIVATSPTSADVVAFATDDQRLWVTSNATAATPAWTEVTGDKPGGLQMSSIAIDAANQIYVLLQHQVHTGSEEFGVTSPLFRVSGSSWVHLPCTGLPTTDAASFTKLVVDPVQAGTLYAGHDASVFRLAVPSGGPVAWTDLGATLPGQWIYDLWCGNVGTAAAPKVLLRAAIPTRGMWEADVTAGATVPALGLYLRDNVLDMGRLPTSPDGTTNPYDPGNPGATLFHYQCADIKVDALQQGSTAAVADFFQTDPEGALPLSHVQFEQLKDNSDNLPDSDAAMVHVLVHNRGTSVANNVRVWALYCNASAGVPSLAASASSGDSFAFWREQFQVTGQIVPALPADSPWRPIGPPQTLSGIDPAHPKVASWRWTVPTLPSGDPGHYCVVAFVHSSGSPINEAGYDVDAITPGNKQIGQKNLHVGPPLPPRPASSGGGPGPSPGPSPGGGSGPGGAPGRRMLEYVEFHNATAAARESSFVLDLRGLPPEIRVTFLLSKVTTTAPLPSSITGVKLPGSREPHGLVGHLVSWIDRIEDELEEAAGDLRECLGRWLENLGRRLEHRPPRQFRARHLPAFEPTVHTALPSSRVEIRGVQLPPHGSAAALLSIENRGTLPEGAEYTFHVQQWSLGKLVGGSAYRVRIAGTKQVVATVPTALSQHLDVRRVEQLEREAKQYRVVPPFIESLAAQAEDMLGKRV